MNRDREVALFVDFENIRYSVLNTYHRELSGSLLMEIGRNHGLVTLARAYADFEEHPERVQRDLQVSGITAVNVSSLQVGDRPKGGADLEMLCDMFETLLDRPNVSAFLLMTGDRRFIRMVTMIRNRYGKDVIIAGVRGSVSNDLIEAAGGNFEPLEFEPVAAEQKRDAFVRFVDRLERSKPFITFKYVAAAMTTSIEFPGMAEDEAREYVAQAIEESMLRKEQRPDGYRVLLLNREHEEVCEVLGTDERTRGEEDGDDYDDDPEYDDGDVVHEEADGDEGDEGDEFDSEDADSNAEPDSYATPRGRGNDDSHWNR